MKPQLSSLSVALAASALVIMPARAQPSLALRLGLNVSTAPYATASRSYQTTTKPGAEIGLMAAFRREHLTLQTALLFSQKGFNIDDDYTDNSSTGQVTRIVTTGNYRLNYLTLPIALAYTQRADGQGLQVFAGPYAGLLLGGKYTAGSSYSVSTPHSFTGGYTEKSGSVAAGDIIVINSFTDNTYYSRRFDAGLQGGVGYCYRKALLQIGYSLGLRNLGADYAYGVGLQNTPGPSYRNRAFQISFSYWLLP